MSTPKTHLLRAKPPWRDGADLTVCGRRPDAVMVITVSEVRSRLADDRTATIAAMCATCRDRSRAATVQWQRDPIGVIELDLPATFGPGPNRHRLANELRAPASLAAEHPDRFRELLEGEQVMQALAGLMRG